MNLGFAAVTGRRRKNDFLKEIQPQRKQDRRLSLERTCHFSKELQVSVWPYVCLTTSHSIFFSAQKFLCEKEANYLFQTWPWRTFKSCQGTNLLSIHWNRHFATRGVWTSVRHGYRLQESNRKHAALANVDLKPSTVLSFELACLVICEKTKMSLVDFFPDKIASKNLEVGL